MTDLKNWDSFAELDFEREQRCGFPEVVYGAGKSAEQVAAIMHALAQQHDRVLCTRASAQQAEAVQAVCEEAGYLPSCNIIFIDKRPRGRRIEGADVDEVLCSGSGSGCIIVCCAGTSDLAIAQEAAITAHLMGSQVRLLTDVGVAGVHRVLSHEQELRQARAIVAVAGMEGALPSLVAGLVDVPVIAVPTSVGYGASFGGIAALLGMLNSCCFGQATLPFVLDSPPVPFATKLSLCVADS